MHIAQDISLLLCDYAVKITSAYSDNQNSQQPQSHGRFVKHKSFSNDKAITIGDYKNMQLNQFTNYSQEYEQQQHKTPIRKLHQWFNSTFTIIF